MSDGDSQILKSYVLALRASGQWLRYTTLQNLIPSFPGIAPPRPPPWHNPRKGRDQILPSGNLGNRINTKEECEAAAKELERYDPSGAMIGNSESLPPNCVYLPLIRRLYFNDRATPQPCSGIYPCICKGRGEQSSTQVNPLFFWSLLHPLHYRP